LYDYEKLFISKMARLRGSGVEFETLAREALSGKFGGAVDVLLKDLSAEALRNPEDFVREMSKIFGRGALGVFEPIVRYVELGMYGQKQDSPILQLLREIGPASGNASSNGILLHVHRVKDEQDNYADNAN
jgi:hypothetical protein